MGEGDTAAQPERRDFLYIATGSVGAVASVAAVWPLIDQMNPDATVRALATVDVNIADVTPGMQITVQWRGKPVFIRRRTPEEIAEARLVPLDELRDEEARNGNLADDAVATDENRTLDEAGEWLVMVGVCTHFAVFRSGMPLASLADGSVRATAPTTIPLAGSGRGPAPENLAVPPAVFLTDTTIRLG